jgi:hypothetical protein
MSTKSGSMCATKKQHLQPMRFVVRWTTLQDRCHIVFPRFEASFILLKGFETRDFIVTLPIPADCLHFSRLLHSTSSEKGTLSWAKDSSKRQTSRYLSRCGSRSWRCIKFWSRSGKPLLFKLLPHIWIETSPLLCNMQLRFTSRDEARGSKRQSENFVFSS